MAGCGEHTDGCHLQTRSSGGVGVGVGGQQACPLWALRLSRGDIERHRRL